MTETWLKVGATVFVRGNNDHYVGRITAILPGQVVALEDASWVANSGRLSEFCKNGKAESMEVEPVGRIVQSWDGIIEWPHKLFTKAV